MTAAGNGWIEWNGGECPVSGTVDVKLRRAHDDTEDFLLSDCKARDMRWRHIGNESDIVAYRLVDAPGASTIVGGVSPCGRGPIGESCIPGPIGVKPLDGLPSALSTQPSGTHYRDSAIQPVQFIEANKLGFLEGCIVKRATRHNHPTGKGAEDIRKIIHEARLILELRYGEVA